MSILTDYYRDNLKENDYTMKGTCQSSRVTFLKEWVEKFTKTGAKILDVGCGDMYLSKVLPEYEWTGIDVNTIANDGKCIVQDLEKFPYPFPNASFDTIICSEVLEHLYDPVKVTQEIARLLKPNGYYIFSTPNFDWAENFFAHFRPLLFDPAKSWTKEHIHQYNPESHKLILSKANLRLLEYKGADPHFGYFFQGMRKELTKYLRITNIEANDAAVLADVLISNGFKDFSHTVMGIAQHG